MGAYADTIHPDTWMKRGPTADALTKRGRPITASTLATYRTRGGGPPFKVWGAHVLYRWGDVWEWSEARFTLPRSRRRRQQADASASQEATA